MRLHELVDQRTSWHRGLWQLSTVLALRETLEYADLVDSKAQRPEGLHYVAAVLSRQVMSDPGCGGPAVREAIVEHLRPVLPKPEGRGGSTLPAVNRRALEQLLRRIDRGYLERWAEAADKGFLSGTRAGGLEERFARSVAAYVLDSGLSGHHLHGWLNARRRPGVTIPDLLSDAERMVRAPARGYVVVIPFRRLAPSIRTYGERGTVEILSPGQLEEACRNEGVATPRRRAGAMQLRISARDPWTALAEADAFCRRLIARTRFAGKDAVHESKGLVLGSGEWRPLVTWQLRVRMPAIDRRSLFIPQPHGSHGIDDALELLVSAAASTSGATVSASWAALEALLADPGEPGVVAADRLAAILACSYPRAELSGISRAWMNHGGDDVAKRLKETPSHSEQAGIVIEALIGGCDVPDSVAAAAPLGLGRVGGLLADPSAVLTRVQSHLCSTIRRLYHQRNLVMHQGSVSSVTMSATVRCVPALVAAGVDRIVNAAFDSEGTTGISLAARAENEIGLLGTADARPVHRLLD